MKTKGMKEEVIKYADLVMSMSLDFKMDKIDYILYADNLLMIATKLKEITDKPETRGAEE